MNLLSTNTERQTARFEVQRLVYVELPGERAFMLNVSPGGMAIQAMRVLEPGWTFPFAVLLPNESEGLQAAGQVVWSDQSGRAGIKFTQMLDIGCVRSAAAAAQSPLS